MLHNTPFHKTHLEVCQDLDKVGHLKMCFFDKKMCFITLYYAVVHSTVIIINIICIYYIIFEIQTFLLLVHGDCLLSYAACMLIRVLVVEQVPFLPQCMVIKKSSKLFISFMTETAL